MHDRKRVEGPWLRTAAVCVGLAGCASSSPPAPQHAASGGRDSAQLEAALELQGQRISQLENRMALLEAEAREIRHTLQAQRETPLRETVRISAAQRKARVEAEPPDDDRPVLKLHGRPKALAARQPLPEVPVVQERLDVAPLPPGDVEALQAPPANPAEAYRAALGLVREREFDQALSALSAYLVRYPGDRRTAQVLFWRGEVLFALRDFEAALASFEGALRADPGGTRAPDALLKVSLCHRQLGAVGAARAALRRLKTKYPDSEAAKLASQEDAT